MDAFIRNLWNIHLHVKQEGYTHDFSLGMFRSDYMLHDSSASEPLSLKQVEFNTISSSFGGLSSRAAGLHAYLLKLSCSDVSIYYPKHPLLAPDAAELPPNEAVLNLVSGLLEAHKAYGRSKSSPSLPTCILFLVQPNERNIFDQLALSYDLITHRNIPAFRLEVPDILKHTTVPPSSVNTHRPLIYNLPSCPEIQYEVSTVYFRALYSPTEYTGSPSDSTSTWFARLHLERSAAIKCPTILTHLAGCKKIQQVLADPSTSSDVLKRFLPYASQETISSLASTFAPQYALYPGSSGLDLALNPTTAANHVLKPQREGGGNNIYRSAITPFLAAMSERERARWVLMELIQTPAAAKNSILRSDGTLVPSGDVISELGIFGTILWRRRRKGPEGEHGEKQGVKMLRNEEGGYLLRTKARESDEGGVAAGFGALDSVVLYG